MIHAHLLDLYLWTVIAPACIGALYGFLVFTYRESP